MVVVISSVVRVYHVIGFSWLVHWLGTIALLVLEKLVLSLCACYHEFMLLTAVPEVGYLGHLAKASDGTYLGINSA